jgi:hypothetical protein
MVKIAEGKIRIECRCVCPEGGRIERVAEGDRAFMD